VLAAGVSVKLFAVVAVLPLVAILWRRRAGREALAAAGGAVAVVVALVLVYRNVLPEVWRGVFGAHLHARGGEATSGQSNLSRLVHVPDLRSPFGWLVLSGLALALLALVRRRPLGLWPLWLFALGAGFFTLAMHPLLDHHLVLIATALAVPSGAAIALTLASRPLPRWSLVLLALAVCAGFVQEHRRIARNTEPPPADYSWATRYVAAHTSASDLVVSDIPSIPYLAGRRQPGQLIDTSIARIVDEYLPPRQVLALVDRTRPRLVVVGRNFLSHPEIVRGIARRYPRGIRHGEVTIYRRS
jgi:hypothetical protein